MPFQKHEQKKDALLIWLYHWKSFDGRPCFQVWSPERFVAKWHLLLCLTPYYLLLLLWGSVDFSVIFFFFKVGLFYVSLINWVVKPFLKNSTQSDNAPETVSCSFWGQHFVYREITLRWKKNRWSEDQMPDHISNSLEYSQIGVIGIPTEKRIWLEMKPLTIHLEARLPRLQQWCHLQPLMRKVPGVCNTNHCL